MFDISNMRFRSPLDDVLGTALGVRVVRALSLEPRRAVTSRELAGGVGASTSQCIRTLERLERVGLVSGTTVGKAVVWNWETEHVLAEILSETFHRESELQLRLNETLTRWVATQPVRSAALYGSVARGDETESSDIDLHLVANSPAAKETIDADAGHITELVARKFGNPLSLLIHDPATLVRLRGKPLLINLQREERKLEIPRHD